MFDPAAVVSAWLSDSIRAIVPSTVADMSGSLSSVPDDEIFRDPELTAERRDCQSFLLFLYAPAPNEVPFDCPVVVPSSPPVTTCVLPFSACPL